MRDFQQPHYDSESSSWSQIPAWLQLQLLNWDTPQWSSAASPQKPPLTPKITALRSHASLFPPPHSQGALLKIKVACESALQSWKKSYLQALTYESLCNRWESGTASFSAGHPSLPQFLFVSLSHSHFSFSHWTISAEGSNYVSGPKCVKT